MSSSGFAALCSAFGRYDVVHIHAEGPAFFAWLPKLLGKRVVVTIHGIDCPDYVDETVSMKVVRIIQGYVNVVNKMVWRKY